MFYNLMSERKKKKLTQVQMAEKMNMTRMTYRRKETGETKILLAEAFEIMEILELPIGRIKEVFEAAA